MLTRNFGTQQSTFQDLVSFFTVLNETRTPNSPLLKKGESPRRIIRSLERQFAHIQQEPVFRRLGKHRQLALNFAQTS